MARHVLLMTNDFPPGVGGIERYCHQLSRNLKMHRVTVCAPGHPRAEAFDRNEPYEVIRDEARGRRSRLRAALPVERKAVYAPQWWGSRSGRRAEAAARAIEVVKATRPDVVCFGSAFPLGLLAGPITEVTGVPCIAFTHGVEASVAGSFLEQRLFTRMAQDVQAFTAASRWTADRIAGALHGKRPVEVVYGGVDVNTFHPEVDGGRVRARFGIGAAPVCVCVGRLVLRKGQDQLIRAWPEVTRRVPGARLLLVGDGPDAPSLRRMANGLPVDFAGAVSAAEVPAYFAAGDVFAMPCRTRLWGADLEGLGIAFLEASATGLPVVVGRAAGAPETVEHGVTGLLADGNDPSSVADTVATLLADPDKARVMGRAGREHVVRRFTWTTAAARLEELMTRVADNNA